MLIINEIDKDCGGQHSSGGFRSSMSDAFLPLLKRSTMKHFRCPSKSVTVDLDEVLFVLAVNIIYAIDPVLLSRMRVFRFRA